MKLREQKNKKYCCENQKESPKKLSFFNKNPKFQKHNADCRFYIESKSEEILQQADLLKYKMGRHLLNSKERSFTFSEYVKRYWLRVVFIFFAALIFNFGAKMFLVRGDTIPSGLSGIPILINILIPETKPYYALIYLGVNLPLIFTVGLKIKRTFTVLTVLFMIFQIGTDFVFSLNVVHDFLVNSINFGPELKPDHDTWIKLLYGVLGAAFIASGIALSWKSGGSTGGTDFIVYYFSTKLKKNVALVMSVVSITTAIVFLVIFGIFQPHPITEKSPHRVYFGMRELSTFVYLVVNNLIVNLLYPKYKKVKLSISCSNPTKVLAYFKLINYWHGYEISSIKSGYSGAEVYKIDTVCLLFETRNIIEDLKSVDPTVWITVYPITKVVGSFNTQYVES
ncbi:YitT family protein [Mycoplasmopsis anatis]|uniref:YitT family protein n=1 Tax=Mycoplasmopsis anatis TaxID=171279 RepID=UPI001C4E089E|nr:YitT family protein [Mycoplasmopsis anatis]MBW0594607.1 YitT family protein [Mycoplasmopsis anatis]MBW0595463.1 YitT family protein [Mycoplasmopsis anatis]MBW0597578.1 YitT family protein [Mycoplasmopsis anatis]MBW0598210.1 YitT family protein [Mycoplasmopsis anatis]MBW0598874.1 YitT family protein [Mycoplasmopsis anatis]